MGVRAAIVLPGCVDHSLFVSDSGMMAGVGRGERDPDDANLCADAKPASDGATCLGRRGRLPPSGTL